MTAPKPVTLLIVDDDRVEVKSMRRSLVERRIANPVAVATDGVEALEILRGHGQREPLARPYLILLDLNMPRMGGIEFLEQLREDPEHRGAIVFVLTTSREEEDRVKAYEYNVAGYIVKSEFSDRFMKVIDMLESYWRIVELPE